MSRYCESVNGAALIRANGPSGEGDARTSYDARSASRTSAQSRWTPAEVTGATSPAGASGGVTSLDSADRSAPAVHSGRPYSNAPTSGAAPVKPSVYGG